jgi:hypothetical protein
MDERWVPIPGFGRYEVSSLGRVRNLTTGRLLSGSPSTKGYININLQGEHGPRMQSLHRVVLAAFTSECADLQVRHIDGCKTNNHLDNLEWGTAKENARDKERVGTSYRCRESRGETTRQVEAVIVKAKRKLTLHDVREMRALYQPGIVGPGSLARRFGVSEATAERVLTRKSWRWA